MRVGAIEVRGAERAKESMVRDRVRLKVGDLYRPSRARDSQDACSRSTCQQRIVGLLADLTCRRAARRWWSTSPSARRSGSAGARLQYRRGRRGGLEYGYRNLFEARCTLPFADSSAISWCSSTTDERRYESLPPDQRTEYQATLSFGVPYVPHLPKIRMGLDLSVLADIQRDFRMQKESGVASLLYRPARRWTLALAEELEFSDFLLFEQDLDNIGLLTIADLVPEGANTLLSTQLTAAWDRRDRAFNARRGFLISVTSEWARTLAGETARVQNGGEARSVTFQSNMLRFTGSFAFYVPLGPKLTFASQTRYGRVVHLVKGSQSYPNRRFYLGARTPRLSAETDGRRTCRTTPKRAQGIFRAVPTPSWSPRTSCAPLNR